MLPFEWLPVRPHRVAVAFASVLALVLGSAAATASAQTLDSEELAFV